MSDYDEFHEYRGAIPDDGNDEFHELIPETSLYERLLAAGATEVRPGRLEWIEEDA
jgi:hypothetical protein